MKLLTPEEIRTIELKMLKSFSDFCMKNRLHYMLAYGTLLGAVRHKGFIPWDDDIDVIMPRKDYNRLLRYYKNGNKIDGLELLYSTSSNEYYYPFAKLCNPKTVAKMKSIVTEHGIWIDVFPVDKVPEDGRKARKHQKHMIFLRRIVISSEIDFKNCKFNIKTIPKFLLNIYARLKGKKRLTRKMELEAQRFNRSGSKFVCPVSWQSVVGGIMTESEMYDCILGSFEQYEFCIPRCYDKYLRSIYGDYSVLPPKKKRTTHGLEAYYKPGEEEL